MSRLLRDGEYVVFHNSTYDFFGDKGSTDEMVYIVSRNKDNLQNGFIPINVEYNKKYGFFQCRKEVPKNEITEAYKIKTHAVYKGITLDIIGGRKGILILSTPYRLPYNPTGEQLETKNFLIEKGFHEGEHEKGGCWYDIEADIDDPDLELIEEMTEIDINML
ncbi:MAG: hypothetical protein K2K57_07905 [Oscillospiraceae bacterium]|nr:hypothetical protein [Oscillospiraceae bacterium]